jgi:hypothetical protein
MQRLRSVALAIVLGLLIPQPALGVNGVSLSPSTQTHPDGEQSSWTGAWSGGPSPYNYNMSFGDGAHATRSTSSTTKGFSHSFSPCTTQQFSQTLTITDSDGDHKTSNTTKATEGGGQPC